MTDLFKTLLPAIVILLLGFAGLAISILVRKNGRFPNIHIHSNKILQNKDVHCIQKEDRDEQAKAQEREKFRNLKYMKE